MMPNIIKKHPVKLIMEIGLITSNKNPPIKLPNGKPITPKLLVMDVMRPNINSGIIACPADKNKILANPTESQLTAKKAIYR